MNPNKYPSANPHETAPEPNYFEGMSSVQEVLPEYERLLGGAIDEYNEPALTSGFVQGISTRIEGIMSTAGAILPGMLDDDSKAILESSRKHYDVRSKHIPGMFARAHPEMQPALQIIRDAGLLTKAREAVAKSNPYSRLVVETVGKGATPIARDAMQIVINADEHAKQRIAAERNQQRQGAAAEQPRRRTGSAQERTSHDMFAEGGLFGGEVGGKVFDALFGNAERSPRGNTGGSVSGTRRNTNERTQAAPDRDPAQEQQRRIKGIVDGVAAKNKEYAWVLDELDAATRVVEYVDGVRQEAAKEGKVMTAKQIYAKLRLAAETDASKIIDVQTLEAMMNGVDGELPF